MSDARFLTAVRNDRERVVPEVEGVLVHPVGRDVTLVLDDGETLTFDRDELAAALTEDAA